MGKLKSIFQKQGGWKLVKQYWQSGSLFTAIGEILLLGKSRTALEILRLSTHLKIKQKLEKKYLKKLKIFESTYNSNVNHKLSNKVWVCWFQGIENAPEVVKVCYKSLKDNLVGKEIILITEKNMLDYVTFPDFILEKWNRGKITKTHMTDLLRLELLIKYGGLWIDSTVLCTSNEIPEYIFDSDLFFYQCLKPGRDGHSHVNSSWLISAKTNNKILMATKYLCYEYWKKNNSLMDYFLLHDFLSIVLDFYPDDWNKIIPCSNSTPHILALRLFDEYDENVWNAIKKMTCFHKLTYKFDKEKLKINNTYYKNIIC
ncbi:MAG: capsular biosynthesis protein [Clostridia bacterium]|nr:capsular biosynthesis protein [Clostridia bacterium]